VSFSEYLPKYVPDPHSSPEGRKLLAYKDTLNNILIEISQDNPLDLIEEVIEVYRGDLNKLVKGITKSRGRASRAQFLISIDAVAGNAEDAREDLLVTIFCLRTLKSGRQRMPDMTDAVRELNRSLRACQGHLQDALRQFRI
jgi:hypothetical protein